MPHEMPHEPSEDVPNDPADALPASLFALGGTIRHLRAQIEAVTGRSFARLPTGALALREGGRSRMVSMAAGRPYLVVAPGPLLSPYDTPANGLSSLRISYAGRPFGGGPPEAGLGPLLRARGLSGTNRFPRPGTVQEAVAGRPILALVEPETAASPRRLRRFVGRVLAAFPGERVLAAGSEGVPGLPGGLSPLLSVHRDPVDPWALFPCVARVCVARREVACEARLAGAETVCVDPAGGGPSRAPDDAALLGLRYGLGVHGFDPWTRRPIPVAEAVERVAWLRDRFTGNGARVVHVGISRWKRPALDVFATGPRGAPIHAMTAEDAVAAATRHRAQVRAWATRMPEHLPRLCAEAGLPLARVEDGFLRSVGLGASLRPGASIVVDDQGIYYDPRRDSRLALILKETDFPPDLVARARGLREAIVARRLSKYNVGLTQDAIDWPSGRRIVLVPGQVEDDASVRYGSPRVRSNLDLLRAARERNPDAYLLYKPHPDVEAGFRPGAIPQAQALALADRLVGGLAIVDLLDRVHHVETMTSLAGFEALIRGLTVAVHGRPFYAGWGLTEDVGWDIGRDEGRDSGRGRLLSLDELAAAALILYPRYLDPVAMKPCEPEQLLDRLSAALEAAPPSRLALGAVRHATMRARYALLDPIVRRLRARRGVGGGMDGAPR